MQFEAERRTIDGKETWACLFLDDRMNLLCSLAVPEDTITFWHGAWLRLIEDRAGRAQCDALLALAEECGDCDPKHLLIYLRVLYGLLACLQTAPASAVSNGAAGAQAISAFINRHIFFGWARAGAPTKIQMGVGAIDGDDRAARKPVLMEPETDPTWTESWLASFFKQGDPDGVQIAIEYYEFLYESVRLQTDVLVVRSFVSFSRALAMRLEDDRYQHYRRRLQDVYEVIVRHEEDLNVAREALRYILRGHTAPAEKWRRLALLVHHLKRASAGRRPADGGQGGMAGNQDERLATLTGLIADHYLDKYNLPRAIATWKRSARRDDRLLNTLLTFLQKPGRILGLCLITFLLLIALAVARQYLDPNDGDGLLVIEVLAALVLVAIFARPFQVMVSVIRNLFFTRRLYYGQLFLPRLLGAIVVGLSALTLNDIPYKIAIRSTWLALVPLAFVVYFLSYLYIFVDVYQTIKFEPWSELHYEPEATIARTTPGRRSRFLRLGGRRHRPGRPAKARRDGDASVLGYASGIALQVFMIGVVQSFLVTLFISGFILYPVFTRERLWMESQLGWVDIPFGELHFIFVPPLVLLWTGMALFIGAFVQLLWQERGVTSPVRE